MAAGNSKASSSVTRRGAKARGSIRLDDQLCFALYAASRAVTQRYRPLLDELGLTYPQYLVMLVLWEQGPTTVKSLAEALQLDYGTLSPLLKRLAATGLVARKRRSEDERSVEISLTPAGAELKARASEIPQLVVDAYNLDAHEFTSLRDTLRELTESVNARSTS
jgi:DNA-binding MarR family transcriptional regulator